MEDVLRDMPFVLVRQNSRGMAEISVRGSESRQVAVLLDGVPLTLAWDHRTDPAIIPLLGAQSLSLVRGLPSMLTGPNVLGGVIEVDVGRPGRGATARTDLRATMGVDDAGYRAVGVAGTRVTDRDGGARLVTRGGAGYRSRDGLALAGGVVDPAAQDGLRTNSDSQELSGFGSLHWEGLQGRWMSLSASAFRAERGVPPELHLQQPRLWRYPLEWQSVAALSAGTGQRDTPWGTGDLEASFGLNAGEQYIDAFSSLAYQDVVETEIGRSQTYTFRLLGDHTLGRDGELKAAATFADVHHTEVLDGTERNQYRQRLWSVASEVAWQLPGSTRLSTGLALDGADTPETGGRAALGSLSAMGGRLGLTTLAWRPDVQFHGSFSSRSRFPALRELYSGALGRFLPNPDLKPERLRAFEAGATFKQPGIEIQSTVFRHNLSDAVVRTRTDQGQFLRVNRDQIRSFGLELMVNAKVGPAALLGDVTLQSVEIEDVLGAAGAVRPEHMPEFRTGLELDAPLPGGITALTRFNYTGSQYCVHPDFDTEVQLDASARMDFGVRRSWSLPRSVWQRLRMSLSFDNLTNATAYDQCGMPQPGRTVRVGLELM